MKNRTRIDIYASILQALEQSEEGLKLTRISYAAGIPTDRARKYLNLVMSAGLVAPSKQDFSVYVITKHGLKFLESFYILNGYLNEMDEDIKQL